MTKRAVIVGVLSSGIAGCLPGDAAFKIKGRLVDEHATPYEACTLSTLHDGRNVHRSSVSGHFEKTIVFGATGSGPVNLAVTCVGAGAEFHTVVERMPSTLSEAIDLGTVVLQRARTAP